jgi:hypothetical protein
MSLRDRTKHSKKILGQGVFLALALSSLTSCQDITQAEASKTRNPASGFGSGATYIYADNPVVLTGNQFLKTPDWGKKLILGQIDATHFLENKCTFKQDNYFMPVETSGNCLEVYKDPTSALINSNNGSWNFATNSDAFYQVNTYYHAKRVIDRFLASLEYAHYFTHMQSSLMIPPATKHDLGATQNFWLGKNGLTNTLKVYSKCAFEGVNINAYFSPAKNELCMGWNSLLPHLHMAQDPGVIYHEMGHVFVKIMMNQRNTIDTGSLVNNYQSIDFHSELGVLSYDEAGAINEGLADFFTFYMLGRPYIGEWGMDRIPAMITEKNGFQGVKYGRPMTEDSHVHIAGVSSHIPGEKLSYPEYVNYNAHTPSERYEGRIHYAGQIISHYMVRLATHFKNSCTLPNKINQSNIVMPKDFSHFASSTLVMMLINETLAELGDMTAKGSDFFNEYLMGAGLSKVFFTNLNQDEAFLWAHQVTPPDMRRFFKIFAKNIKHYISDPFNGLCPQFSVDMSEQLLDEYGLLLFKSYGDRGQGVKIDTFGNVTDRTYANYANTSIYGNWFSPSTTSSEVNELNRKKTVLISKNLLSLPANGSSRPSAYVFDGRSEIEGILSSITFQGTVVPTSTNLADVKFNNKNIKISPGEIVGVALNLVNNSNSIMSGVQVLANDWDHMALEDSGKLYVNRQENQSHSLFMDNIANWKPCQIDGWPQATEGAIISLPGDPSSEGRCNYVTRTNSTIGVTTQSGINYPFYRKDAPQPACLVQFSDQNETKWVSQDFYRKYVLNLEDHECLNNEASGLNFNPNECLIRTLPGANQAVFDRIDPQSTWLETISKNNPNPRHSAGNLILMEVNKWIQPGTTFNCRFRARFTNCQDCFNNNNSGEDYKDYEYAGHTPFKVINFSFKVID